MKFFNKITKFFDKYFFNVKWRCNVCGKEIFKDGYFCEDCVNQFPFHTENICSHCGRATPFPTSSCLNCENKLVHVDKARSLFRYDKPIDGLIMQLKYGGRKYIAETLIDFLYAIYLKSDFDADVITFVPMSRKAQKRRKYNHAEILADKFSEKSNLPIVKCLEKIKETERQAKLKGKERQINLIGAFKVVDKALVKDKSVLLIDDVTTTGATSEIIAERLKKAGAKKVYLLTLANVSICC
ncbi:MAG: ComF family protein [Clostridiales bacterium]|nr:ComF family protein [Clostridiales bacterium]